MIRWIKSLFGVYEPGYKYWIKLSKIHIMPYFWRTEIGQEKYKRKLRFYRSNGYCESKIVLNKDFTLVNGFSSYVILKAAGEEVVPVFFEG